MPVAIMVQPLALPHPAEEPIQVKPFFSVLKYMIKLWFHEHWIKITGCKDCSIGRGLSMKFFGVLESYIVTYIIIIERLWAHKSCSRIKFTLEAD